MSGDGNSSGGGSCGGGSGRRRSGGFDLNSFNDWASMYNFLGTPGLSPDTQGSTTPAAYQTPHFDVDAYCRPSPPQRNAQSPGLSQIPEMFLPPERTLPDWPIGGGSGLRIGVNAEDEEEEEGAHEVAGDGTRHPYGQKETLALYDAWISVSYDPVVGNQQNNKCFWKKVTEEYNARRPKNTAARNVKMLRSHWGRCDKDVKKFCAVYRAEEANYQSGASGADILRAALRVFKDDVGKDFKFVDVWSQVHHLDRWAGGVESGSGSKRTKHTARGNYSSSDGGEGHTSQEATPTDDTGGSSGSRRRPQGTKAAKAARARARGKGKGRGESSQAGSGSGAGSGSNSLMSMYLLATMADTSKMNPRQFEAHMDGIEHMKAQLGIRDRSTLGAPPTSGDDSPAE